MKNDNFTRNIDVFLLQEIQENGFNRYDIIVRLLAIEQYYGKNKYGFEFYNKMQKARFLQKPFIQEAQENKEKSSLQKFLQLIKSVEENGYINDNHPILLNDIDHLINGSHRLSLCFYYNIDYVKCTYSTIESQYYDHIQYDFKWFKNHFYADECMLIKRRLEILLDERGSLAYSVVWPCAYEYVDTIEKIVSKYFRIVSYIDIHFAQKKDLIDFIELVYSRDPYRADRANDKLKNIFSFTDCKIRIYQMKYNIKNTMLQEKICSGEDARFDTIPYLQKSKNNIRREIEQIMDKYVFDNAFHCGQTIDENIFIQQIYEKHQMKRVGKW